MTSLAKGTLNKITVMQAFADGAIIERNTRRTKVWSSDNDPSWDWNNYEYRVKPTKPDWVDWDAIATRFKYMARDEDDHIFLYEEEPRIVEDSPVWTGFGACRIDLFYKGYKDNGGPWRNSLVVRPEATE